jgi:ubiquinone/menaquinone biosynthesis C-methylase UbiE/uncharacterized protein YbaR (Trm112 family)
VPIDLACPRCRSGLRADDADLECPGCGARYPVVGDVPLLTDQAMSEQHRMQRAYFDAEFSHYAAYRLENWRRSFVERIFQALGIEQGRGPYLDVGVGGSGATVIEAARLGVEATGCDLSMEGVLAARRFAVDQGVGERAQFVAAPAEALPFADRSFAAASAVAVLEHLDSDAAAASEIARVLQPKGLVWITVPHAYRYILPPLWPVYWWHDRRIGHKRHYDAAGLERLFRSVGLEHVATRYSGHPVKLLQFAATAVPAVRRRDSRLWWRLERRDHGSADKPLWALQLNAVFRRSS